jgi:hypothetical protein
VKFEVEFWNLNKAEVRVGRELAHAQLSLVGTMTLQREREWERGEDRRENIESDMTYDRKRTTVVFS